MIVCLLPVRRAYSYVVIPPIIMNTVEKRGILKVHIIITLLPMFI